MFKKEIIDISVIIVTWNAQKYIKTCLNSVLKQENLNLEIIIVDNGSTDRTLEILKSSGLGVTLIKNRDNKGFCTANNQGIDISSGKYIFTLNSDVILEPEYIMRLKNCLEANPKVGMNQGKFLRMDKKTIDSLGLRLSWAKRLFNIAEGQIDNQRYKKQKEIFGPCAAAALYKRELVDQIKWKHEFFDSNFFFLVEDFDVAWRAQRLGWKALYVPSAVCYHYRGSSDHVCRFKQYLSFRNRYFLLLKNLTGIQFILMLPVFLIYDLPRFLYLSVFNKYTFKAIKEIIVLFPNIRSKRKII